jgi:hypothetical protein
VYQNEYEQSQQRVHVSRDLEGLQDLDPLDVWVDEPRWCWDLTVSALITAHGRCWQVSDFIRQCFGGDWLNKSVFDKLVGKLAKSIRGWVTNNEIGFWMLNDKVCSTEPASVNFWLVSACQMMRFMWAWNEFKRWFCVVGHGHAPQRLGLLCGNYQPIALILEIIFAFGEIFNAGVDFWWFEPQNGGSRACSPIIVRLTLWEGQVHFLFAQISKLPKRNVDWLVHIIHQTTSFCALIIQWGGQCLVILQANENSHWKWSQHNHKLIYKVTGKNGFACFTFHSHFWDLASWPNCSEFYSLQNGETRFS